jgi:ribonucleoside-diphosphate reductase alpha chain
MAGGNLRAQGTLAGGEDRMTDENPGRLALAETPPALHEERKLFARAQRERLPAERQSITHRFEVGGHKGYITVGMYDDGRPGEVFIKMAKEGSTLSGVMDGLALSLSICLQYGVPLKALVDKLTNTRFEPSGFTQNPEIRYASSVLDYIARWLGGKFISSDYLKLGTALSEKEVVTRFDGRPAADAAKAQPAQASNPPATTGAAPSCPTCGMLMVPNGSCYKCLNRGSTSGCS